MIVTCTKQGNSIAVETKSKNTERDRILHEAVMLFLKKYDCDYSLFESQMRNVFNSSLNEKFEEILSGIFSSWVFAYIKDFEPFAKNYFYKKLDPYSWNDDFMHFVEWDRFYSEYREAEEANTKCYIPTYLHKTIHLKYEKEIND